MIICEYCGHPVLPGQPHKICDEIIMAWDEQEELNLKADEEAYEAEICPCGAKHDQHYMGDGYCEVKGCDCPQFGEPPENYETHTITSVSDGPGPFTICE